MTEYYDYSLEELKSKAKINLAFYENEQKVFEELADKMIDVIQKNNLTEEASVIICPVGPVGQYPYFVGKINENKISLKRTWFINMDEYLDDEMKAIDESSDLSFTGFMKREVYGRINSELLMPENQRIFPEVDQINRIPELLTELGKVDLCIGGIGINGHLAFNEPQPTWTVEELKAHKTHIGKIAPETITVAALGTRRGALELIPENCITIGINEIYAAKEIYLGVFRDWHPAVVKRAACGEVTTAFPVSLLQEHSNATILAPQHLFNT